MSAPHGFRLFRTCLGLLSIALASCGGGGGADGGGGGSSGGGSNPPPVVAPPVDRSPELALPISNQSATYLHSFSFDVSQGGRTFSDPDGDPLKYSIKIGHTYNPENDPNPPLGLRVEGTRIIGAPEEAGPLFVVTVTVSDPAGQTANQAFNILVAPNANPVVVHAPDDVIVAAGASIDLDASMNGDTFSDPDGDALTYEVSLRGAAGLSVNGSRLQGRLSNPGLVEVRVTARDAYGGARDDIFQIAMPAATPPAPALPLADYVYNDEALPLPWLYRLSSENLIPFWDTQFNNRTSDAGAALGRVLFHDKRLSITNTLACTSCHDQAHGFASAERFSTGALGIPLARNTMALGNARYNIHNSFFSDMRAQGVREAIRSALENPQEMGGTLGLVEGKVRAASFYPPLFAAAFGNVEVTGDRILDALAQYVNAIISYRSKFDRACVPMDNNPIDCSLVFSAQELRGKELFEGGGNQSCAICHKVPVMSNEWQANNGIDAVVTDPGITNLALTRDGFPGKFRAASLKNIAKSAPYMHDGRFATLRDVIDHYDHGVKDSPNLDTALRDLTGAVKQLNLSEADKEALEAFLNTLTDDDLLSDPRFSDPFE